MKVVKKNNVSLDHYKKLFDTFYTSLCVFSNKYTNNIEISKDIVQEVFIKIWKEQIILKDDFNVKGYLYTIVKNKSLDYLKSKEYKNHVKVNNDINLSLLTSQTYFEKHVLIEETSRLVNQAVNTLPYKCKRIIHLSLKGLGNKQISEELSISLNTVKTQKRIAYQKLRPLLKSAYLLVLNLFF
ncbi:RNA polymerase sigma-70 factor [Postechiella marina]|uniref:RNA polymerase sigma-70 factor n=1 Tax=Postechiella marina TaxID=943941 RepID=A0ABP8CEP1_9FLAO